MTMIQHQYTLRFHAPAFLGNAEQSGQWRTPPFKAQLRQWWRMAYAAREQFQPDVAAMREAEGRLFGHAWLENDRNDRGEKISARRSLVRIRLDQWCTGKLKDWEGHDTAVKHPEVPRPVGAQLYMGYGPLISRNGTALKANAALQAGEHAVLSVAYPDEHAAQIEQALALMHLFGTVGGRSRNGWGSYSLTPAGDTPPLSAPATVRPWREALTLDWPHAIGSDDDGKALIWQTQSFSDWKALMKALAILKIGLRTRFPFATGKGATVTEERHWLSYPVTNHSVQAWGNNARLPNSLRFKVRPTEDGQVVGVIFHTPCLPPRAFNPNDHDINIVWRKVHAFLDAQQQLPRIPA
jgi:CRISPR-associated protein Cmr1